MSEKPTELDHARNLCREICAYKGEPPCWLVDARAGNEWCGPCEVCEPAAAYVARMLNPQEAPE